LKELKLSADLFWFFGRIFSEKTLFRTRSLIMVNGNKNPPQTLYGPEKDFNFRTGADYLRSVSASVKYFLTDGSIKTVKSLRS